MTGFWNGLEGIRGLAGVPATWRRWVGEDFDRVRSAFLRRRPGPARLYPCPVECGCAHEVVERADGGWVAVCRCEPWDCEDVRLPEAEVAVWELNWGRLGRAVAEAFGLAHKEEALAPVQTWQVGTFGRESRPVVLTVQHEGKDLDGVARQLAVDPGPGFILLAPTHRLVSGVTSGLVENRRARLCALESEVEVLRGGVLRARRRAEEVFGLAGIGGEFLRDGGEAGRARNVFQRSGRVWRVVFDGGAEFHIPDGFGARYLDYLLGIRMCRSTRSTWRRR